MNTYRENSYKIIILILAVTIVFNATFVCCKNDLIHWNECTELLVQLQNCSFKLHVPKNCADIQKSELSQCAENVVKNISLCKDPVGVKVIENYVNVYQLSDKILCQDHMHSSFVEDKACAAIARSTASTLSRFTPGSLSNKGCRAIKTLLYATPLNLIKKDCFELLIEFVDNLFNATNCEQDTQIAVPTITELRDLQVALGQIIMCLGLHNDVPSCEKSINKRMKCVNAVDLTDLKNEFHIIIHNLIDTSKVIDEVICSNEALKKEFIDHNDCWNDVRTIIIGNGLTKVNGLLTKEGCEAVKYAENITMASFDQHCAKVLLDFQAEMDKSLPCVQANDEKHGSSMSLPTNNAVLIYFPTLLLIIIIKLSFS